MSYTKCMYHKCENKSCDISMFRFPARDKNRLSLWIRNSGNIYLDSLSNEELRHRYICAAHFPPSCIHIGKVRNRLIGPAAPVHFQCAKVTEESSNPMHSNEETTAVNVNYDPNNEQAKLKKMLNEDTSSVDCTITPLSRRSGPGSSWGTHNINCSVNCCTNSTMSCPYLWFFKLPQHSYKLRRQWLHKIGLAEFQVPLCTLVCEKHFKLSDIGCIYPAEERKCLKKEAIPTLLLPSDCQIVNRSKPKHVYQRNTMQETKCVTEINPTEDLSTQQESPQIDSIDNSHNQMDIDDNQMNNEEENNRDDNQSNNNDNQIDNDGNQSDSDDSQSNDLTNQEHTNSIGPTLVNKTLNSMNDINLKFKYKKESPLYIYSDKYRLKIFQLYLENTQAYELLQSTLELPPVSTLPSYIPSTLDGINNLYMSSILEKIDSMPLNNKYGVICVHAMRIKPFIVYDGDNDEVSGVHLGAKTVPYQYALVAMVRGIFDEWYHIASICLLPRNACIEYNTFLEEVIVKMFAIGLTIKAVVTNTDDMFRTASVIKCKPYFLIKQYRVYHIFDPAHLILLLYDELNHYKGFYSERNDKITTLVKWEHIHDFYEHESTRKFRMTDQSSYIDKNESHQNKLISALQILSLKTAMGISMFFSNNMLSDHVMETVSFLQRINNIFASLYPKAFQYEHKVTQSNYNFWNDNIEYFESIKRTILSKTDSHQLKFPDYLLISIKSISILQQMSYLNDGNSKLMQCLNLDPLVEFIDEIKSKSFKTKYPSVTELCDTLKHGFMQNNHHNITKIEQDNCKLENFIHKATKLSEEICFVEFDDNLNPTDMADYKLFNREDANSMYYIAIYLLDKMYKMYKNALSSRMKHMCSSVSYENKRNEFYGSIIVPDDEFIEFVNKMDIIFVTYYIKAMGTGRLYEELMKVFNKMIVTGPVGIAPLQYIKGLFLELRIYHTINYNNELFENDDCDNHQFVACRLNGFDFRLS